MGIFLMKAILDILNPESDAARHVIQISQGNGKKIIPPKPRKFTFDP